LMEVWRMYDSSDSLSDGYSRTQSQPGIDLGKSILLSFVVPNVKAGPPPVAVPPASAAAPQRAVGPSHFRSEFRLF
jgi:hypothetical protein